MRTRIPAFLCVFLVFSTEAPARTQTQSAHEPAPVSTPASLTDLDKTDDFRPLFQERELLVSRIQALREALPALQAQVANLRDTTTLKIDLERAGRDLETARKSARADTGYVQSIERYITSTERDLNVARSATPAWQKTRDDLDSSTRRLFAVEQRIASLFDATRDINRFRSTVTITFGILVCVVIVGFYVIAWYKQGVATTIFSGEMGMQFVTLFLIVIAIILFGIMGTLEGRELAALLGGLSGYILGRASDGRRTTAPAASAPATPAE